MEAPSEEMVDGKKVKYGLENISETHNLNSHHYNYRTTLCLILLKMTKLMIVNISVLLQIQKHQ